MKTEKSTPFGPPERFWEIETGGRIIRSKAVIIATGVEPKKLGVPGEEELKGRGVSYCATCDGPFFREQEIGVVGGGDSAVEEALYLTRFARKVYLIHRRNALRAEKILQDRAFKNPKIEILWDTVVTKVVGQNGVDGLEVRNVKTQEAKGLKVGGVFFYVGWLPLTGFLKGVVSLDANGYVTTDPNMATSAPGIFAAGDVRQKTLRQVATAVGDGAIAAFSAEKYIESLGIGFGTQINADFPHPAKSHSPRKESFWIDPAFRILLPCFFASIVKSASISVHLRPYRGFLENIGNQ